MRAPRLVVVAALAVGVGCSLTTSLDGLTGGGAATDGGGAASGDGAPSDAPPPDAPIPDDAGSDDASTFCAQLQPTPLFCDAFDHVDPLRLWSATTSDPSFTADVDDAGHSAPSALHCVGPLAPAGGGYVRVEHDRLPQTTSWRFSVAIRVVSYGSSATLLRIGTPGYALRLYAGSNVQAYVDEDFTADGGPPPARFPLDPVHAAQVTDGSWHRLELFVKSGATGDTLQVSLDGASTLQNGAAAVSARLYAAIAYVWLGVSRASATAGSWDVRFDDVVFDAAN